MYRNYSCMILLLCVLYTGCSSFTLEEERNVLTAALHDLEEKTEIDELEEKRNVLTAALHDLEEKTEIDELEKEVEDLTRNVLVSKANGNNNGGNGQGNGNAASKSKGNKDNQAKKVGRIRKQPEPVFTNHRSSKENFIIESENQYVENEKQAEFALKHGAPTKNVYRFPLGIQFEEMLEKENKKSKPKRSHDEGEHDRVKRFGYILNTASFDRRWLKGFIPYKWDTETLNPNDTSHHSSILGRMRAMNHYAYWTCMRPIEYNETTPSITGFSNYLFHQNVVGCWSYLGRLLTKQRISCCNDYLCVHELGHAMGQTHEQNNPKHDDFVGINYQSIQAGGLTQYYEADPAISKVYEYSEDSSSIMHYALWAFQQNFEDTMQFYHPSDKLLLKQDLTGFLMFKEICSSHTCKADHCSHLDGCTNGGYVTQIRGICTCRCVPGLDGVTGCTTEYQKDMTSLQDWPTGPMTLLKTKWGCPEHWTEGQVTLNVRSPSHNVQHAADIDVTADSVTLKLCTKPEPTNPARIAEKVWPAGRYCIMQKGTCPSGFSAGYIEITNTEIPPSPTGDYPSSTYNANKTKINNCCRNDGNYDKPIHLPKHQPFALIEQGFKGCQSIVGMKSRSLYWTIRSVTISNYVPKARVIKKYVTGGYEYRIKYCMFIPEDQDETNPASLWPSMPVKMPKPVDGCPTDFQEFAASYVVDATIITPTPSTIEWNQGSTSTHFEESYCLKTETSGGLGEWGQGQYCIGKVDGVECEGEGNIFGGFKEGTVIIGKFIKKFCCRNDLFRRNPMKMTTADSFVLFMQDDGGCQKVLDMHVHQEPFSLSLPSSASITVLGSVPYIKTTNNNPNKEHTLYLCYYTKYNQQYTGCGDDITLDINNPSAVIQSPNYPNIYPERLLCHWNIKSPEGTRIRLQFEEQFGIEQNGGCISSISIANRIRGQPGIEYCGDAYPQTEISLDNYSGVVFHTAYNAPPTDSYGFKALVTYIENDWLAYSGRGDDYRGTVDVTRENRPCLYWADSALKFCPNNMFNSLDFDDGLQKNYCRNPEHGTEPWCYVEADGCLREYCDVSNLETCYDAFLDCDTRIQENANFCEDVNNEGPRGCARTCRKCRKKPFTKVSDVTCSQPVPLPNAEPEIPLKTSYKVGESVPYKCSTSHEHTLTKCLADGTWSGRGFVCAKCTTGWYAKDGYCYKWFNVYKNKQEVTSICQGFDGVVAPVKNEAMNDFLHLVRGHPRPIWLGMEFNEDVGDHTWTEDGSTLDSTYTRWNEDKYKSNPAYSCGYMHRDQNWKGIPCTASNYFAVVCKNKPQDSSHPFCEDSINYCDETLEDFPRSCVDNLDFAKHNCREACGHCQKPNTTTGTCSHDESLLVNAYMAQGATNIQIGQIYEYGCNTGYTLASGDLVRACKKDSTLTGSPPVCQDDSTIPTPNNAVAYKRRKQIFSIGRTYVAKSPPSRMHKDGNVVSWKFYSNHEGVVIFQIWRFIENDKFLLVGQNVITAYEDRNQWTTVATADQIPVKSGDLIAIYLPTTNNGGIGYDKCNDGYTAGAYGQWFKSQSSFNSESDFTIGTQYTMVPQTHAYYSCKIFSVTAFVQ